MVDLEFFILRSNLLSWLLYIWEELEFMNFKEDLCANDKYSSMCEHKHLFCIRGQHYPLNHNQCLSRILTVSTIRFVPMMSFTFGLFTYVSDSGPHGPLVSSVQTILFGDRSFLESGIGFGAQKLTNTSSFCKIWPPMRWKANIKAVRK